MNNWVVKEEPGYLVVNKPAGVLSQKDKSGDDDLAALLQGAYQENTGAPLPFLAPVHRLDRNTSGLILLAKNPETARELTSLLQAGKINRIYLAFVKGDPGQKGRYDFPLKKNEKTNQSRVDPSGDEAVSEFTRLQKLGNSSVVKVKLETGRSHQIRVHFSHKGHALLGDRKYGKKPWSEIFTRPALHAVELSMPGKIYSAPLPDDMKALLVKLGGKPL